MITYQCNLDCQYCYIGEKKAKFMDLKTAQRILRPILESQGDRLTVILAGAEPLTVFPMIARLVQWAERGNWKRPVHFFGSTNGTLLDDEKKKWFQKHRDMVTLGLSYDGMPQIQNANRTPGGQTVNLDFFQSLWPRQQVQMTVAENSVCEMAEGVIFLLEKGFYVNANVAYEEKEWSNAGLRMYSRQLELLSEYYLSHPEKPFIKQFCHSFRHYVWNLRNNPRQERVCGAGGGYFVFDTDGTRYPCHMLSPLVLTESELADLEAAVTEESEFSDPVCQGCAYISECPSCMGCNFRFRGKKALRDRTHCCLMRLEVRNYLKFRLNQLKAMEKLSEEERQELQYMVILDRWERENGERYLHS